MKDSNIDKQQKWHIPKIEELFSTETKGGELVTYESESGAGNS